MIHKTNKNVEETDHTPTCSNQVQIDLFTKRKQESQDEMNTKRVKMDSIFQTLDKHIAKEQETFSHNIEFCLILVARQEMTLGKTCILRLVSSAIYKGIMIIFDVPSNIRPSASINLIIENIRLYTFFTTGWYPLSHKRAALTASVCDNVEILSYIRENYEECIDPVYCIIEASRAGSCNVLQWIRSTYTRQTPSDDRRFFGSFMQYAAASNGRTNIFAWMRKNNIEVRDEARFAAAEYGHLTTLIYLLKESGFVFVGSLILRALNKKQNHIVQYLHSI
jgi:hypothetical protein